MSTSTLYLCYFGLREPLVQTQVLPYLRHLARSGVAVHLLTFEPRLADSWSAEELTHWEARLAREGIRWHRLPYHKSPSAPATAYDILAGARAAVRIARRERIDVLHARAHVPLVMALIARRFARVRIVFDLRGLMAEEYADAGVWAEGSAPFRAIKSLERAGLRRADQVVVLTRRMRDWLVGRGVAPEKIEVIPCCVDFARFGGDDSGSGDNAGRFEVVYAGAVTGLYLLEEMARFFLEIRRLRPGAFFRVMTTAEPRRASEVLARAGLEESDYHVGAVAAERVPEVLRSARLGLSFRKPTFSQIAASPTKVPEYLAAGLPAVSNAGIGDTDELLESVGVGVVVRDFTDAALAAAAASADALG